MDQLLAQQQAALNAALHNAHQLTLAMLAVYLGLLILTAGVIYMFYARLRDIADELQKFRIAYEHAQDRIYETPRRPSRSEPCSSTCPETPNPFSEDAKYMPKS